MILYTFCIKIAFAVLGLSIYVIMLRALPVFIFSLLICSGLNAQDTVRIYNGSFEDIPRAGNHNNNLDIRGWFDCGLYLFPGESPPDIHPAPDTAWEVKKNAVEGRTYLGMVVRENESWESVTQMLKQPILANQCYALKIYLAQSSTYLSATKINANLQSFTNPAVLRIWGSNDPCTSARELLAESDPVKNKNWKQFTFRIKARRNYKYITLEAFFKTPSLFPYNGHVLVDGLSDFIPMECEEDPLIVFEEMKSGNVKEVAKEPVVQTKINAKPPQPKPKEEPNVQNETPVQREKILKDLARDKIKTGQVIKIEKLYFLADRSEPTADSHDVLEEVYKFLAENENVKVEIGGHTSARKGITDQYCDNLSTARAKSVTQFLIDKGIDPNRLTAVGYGKKKPIASNNTPSGKKRNQRVEIKILSIDS